MREQSQKRLIFGSIENDYDDSITAMIDSKPSESVKPAPFLPVNDGRVINDEVERLIRFDSDINGCLCRQSQRNLRALEELQRQLEERNREIERLKADLSNQKKSTQILSKQSPESVAPSLEKPKEKSSQRKPLEEVSEVLDIPAMKIDEDVPESNINSIIEEAHEHRTILSSKNRIKAYSKAIVKDEEDGPGFYEYTHYQPGLQPIVDPLIKLIFTSELNPSLKAYNRDNVVVDLPNDSRHSSDDLIFEIRRSLAEQVNHHHNVFLMHHLI